MCIARFNIHVLRCALRFARYSFQRICVRIPARCAIRRVARCVFQSVACSSALHFFFHFAKRKKSSAAKEEAAQKETEAAAEGEERKINLGREDEATAHRKYPVT